MSRIGKLPIKIPSGVQVDISKENIVTVKGDLGELKQAVNPDLSLKVEGDELKIERPNDEKKFKALHGLYRALLSNMVKGVSEGFRTVLELVGVGFKAEVSGQLLTLTLGFSHYVVFEMPAEIKVEAVTERGKNPIIILTSHDKQLLGQVAAKIRSLRKPEPYKGKGVRFQGEEIRRKAGKAAAEK